MPPSASTTPRLPAADRAADAILAQLEEWQRDRHTAPRLRLHGKLGVGISTTLARVAEELEARGITGLIIQPPDLDVDGPFHFTMQLATRLREGGANGSLDVVARREARLEDKFAAAIGELERRGEGTVVLLDLPGSWARYSSEAEAIGTYASARSLVGRTLMAAAKAKQPVILGASGWSRAEGEPYLEPISIEGTSDTRLLSDASFWGELADSAASLSRILGQRVNASSPLELRVGVGLLALGTETEQVRLAAEGGLGSLLQLLHRAVERRPTLEETFRSLAVVRFPAPRTALEALVSPDLDETERGVVRRVFLLEHPAGVAMHPALRPLFDSDEPARRSALHARVLEQLEAPEPPTSLPDEWAAGTRVLEYAYHAARGLRVETAKRFSLDSSSLCQIGRALSFAGRNEEALEVYEAALNADPSNEYARAYVPFHLERLGREPGRAETMFCSLWRDRPENAWWARRYIRCLIARGRIGTARDAWLASLGAVSRDADAARRSWLARNFHAGIARGFLDRGALAEAREVLDHVGAREREADLELARLWNRLRHAEEAERLGVAPFPLTVQFEHRWQRPSVLPPSVRYDAWFPGRIVTLGPRVLLDLVERPEDARSSPRPFRLELTETEFCTLTHRSTLDGVEPKQFLELGVAGETRRIELHPIRGRGIEISVAFLSALPADERD